MGAWLRSPSRRAVASRSRCITERAWRSMQTVASLLRSATPSWRCTRDRVSSPCRPRRCSPSGSNSPTANLPSRAQATTGRRCISTLSVRSSCVTTSSKPTSRTPPHARGMMPPEQQHATAGVAPSSLQQNCSGKHAAMLATCRVNGWTIDDYLAPDHPLQTSITSGIEALGATVHHIGVDGCGAPTHCCPCVTWLLPSPPWRSPARRSRKR